MTKPIFIVKCSDVISRAELNSIAERLANQLLDYHVLVITPPNVEDIEFEVLNVINATDIEIEELKEKVLEQIKSIKNEESI